MTKAQYSCLTGLIVAWWTVGDGLVFAIGLLAGASPHSIYSWMLRNLGFVFGTSAFWAVVLWDVVQRSSWGRTHLTVSQRHSGYLPAFAGGVHLWLIATGFYGGVHGPGSPAMQVVGALAIGVSLVAKVAIWRFWWRVVNTNAQWFWLHR